MFEITAFNTVLYGISFASIYYALVCVYVGHLVRFNIGKLLYYISIFCLLGVAGEIFVNTIYVYFFHTPLWEYRLFPTHNKDISFFFLFIWGALGFYKYVNDHALHPFKETQYVLPGLIMGAEAVILEILYNGGFLLLFGSYIFYYFPHNLGIFSHLSCFQVIPFYFIVGLYTHALIRLQDRLGYGRCLFVILPFFWMIILSIVVLPSL